MSKASEFNFGENEIQETQQDLFLDFKPKYTPPSAQLIDEYLKHYRSTGFPYPNLTDGEKLDEFNSLQALTTEPIFNGENVYADSTAVGLANSYHPHRYGVVCNNKRTALYVFGRDWLLRRCIEKCVKMSGSISDSKLRSMISIFEGVQVASNFPPGTAKAIYEHYSPEGGTVWDMSCGFGGRLLAAMSSNHVGTYYGTDPSTRTFEGLTRMCDDLSKLTRTNLDVDICQQGSERPLKTDWKDVDLCFTSPPYFNQEKYAREPSQSFLAYPTRTDWIRKFIGGTVRNCHQLLKPNGKLVVNIANVSGYQTLEKDFIRETESNGFRLIDRFNLLYTAMPGQGKRNRQENGKTKHRTEPIFVFSKS